jgi:hypothetical protein
MQDDCWSDELLIGQGIAVGSSTRGASIQAAGSPAVAGAQPSIPGHVVSALGGSTAVTQEKSMSKPPKTTTPMSARKHTAMAASSSVAGREPGPAEPRPAR